MSPCSNCTSHFLSFQVTLHLFVVVEIILHNFVCLLMGGLCRNHAFIHLVQTKSESPENTVCSFVCQLHFISNYSQGLNSNVLSDKEKSSKSMKWR